MRRASLFWFELILLLLVVGTVAGLLWYTGNLAPELALATVGPVAVTPYLLLVAVFAIGLFAMTLHGWLRQDGVARRTGEAAGAAAAAELLRLISNSPPGT